MRWTALTFNIEVDEMKIEEKTEPQVAENYDGDYIYMPTLDESAHVIPSCVIEKIISGELNLTDIDGWELITRTIFSEWLINIRKSHFMET